MCRGGGSTPWKSANAAISTSLTLNACQLFRGTLQDTLHFSSHTSSLYVYQKSVVCLSKTVLAVLYRQLVPK